jgi:hypothetical protein
MLVKTSRKAKRHAQTSYAVTLQKLHQHPAIGLFRIFASLQLFHNLVLGGAQTLIRNGLLPSPAHLHGRDEQCGFLLGKKGEFVAGQEVSEIIHIGVTDAVADKEKTVQIMPI